MKSALLFPVLSLFALLSSSALAAQPPPATPPPPPPIVEADPNAGKLLGESYRNHVVFNLGIGVGSLSPNQYNLASTLAGGPTANTELHVPLLFTYYAPYYLLLRSGAEAVYFFPSSNGNTNYGGTVEVPIEFGGHFALLDDKLILELAAGPAIAGFTSAGMSPSGPSPIQQQLYADPTVGFDSELKAQYFLSQVFSLGLEIGYRILNTGPLHDSHGISSGVDLDLSGFRVVLDLGFEMI